MQLAVSAVHSERRALHCLLLLVATFLTLSESSLPSLPSSAAATTAGEERSQDDDLRAIVQDLIDQNERIMVQLNRQQAIIDQQHAAIRQLQGGPRGGDRHRQLASSSGVASAACGAVEGAQLSVDGVCSCSEDIVVHNASLVRALQTLDRAVQNISAIWKALDHVAAASEPVDTCLLGVYSAEFEGACQGETVENVSGVVSCSGDSACRYTTFINVDTVICGEGEYACHGAKFINVSNVICNGDSDFNCYYLDVFYAEKVICSGKDSCSGGQVFDTPVVECTGSGTWACYILEVRNEDEIYSVSPCTAAQCSVTGGFQPECWISGAWADC